MFKEFTLAAIITTILIIIKLKQNEKWQLVKATRIGKGIGGETKYTYTFKNRVYTKIEYVACIHTKGDEINILVNPDDPNDAIRQCSITKYKIGLIVTIAMWVLTLILYLNK